MIAQIREAAAYIETQIKGFKADYGVVLGTGLGGLVKDIDAEHTLSYEDIPHFPVSTVEFHSGKLIFGKLGGKNIVAMQGRFHYYEGYSMQQVVFPIRVMKLLGIKKLFVSNAAGGLNPEFAVSDLMIIKDHINLQPNNPLIGPNIEELGPRFPDMSEPYDLSLIEQAKKISLENKLDSKTGVYVSVPGPNLETRAEYRYLKVIGADCVGMSTVPEIIAARHMNIPCFAVSVVTDMCIPELLQEAKLEHIIAAAQKAEPKLSLLMQELIALQD